MPRRRSLHEILLGRGRGRSPALGAPVEPPGSRERALGPNQSVGLDQEFTTQKVGGVQVTAPTWQDFRLVVGAYTRDPTVFLAPLPNPPSLDYINEFGEMPIFGGTVDVEWGSGNAQRKQRFSVGAGRVLNFSGTFLEAIFNPPDPEPAAGEKRVYMYLAPNQGGRITQPLWFRDEGLNPGSSRQFFVPPFGRRFKLVFSPNTGNTLTVEQRGQPNDLTILSQQIGPFFPDSFYHLHPDAQTVLLTQGGLQALGSFSVGFDMDQ